jgi:hypothetical protein
MGLGELSVLKISAVIAATLFSCLALASLGDSLSEKPGALRRGLNSQSVRVKSKSEDRKSPSRVLKNIPFKRWRFPGPKLFQ